MIGLPRVFTFEREPHFVAVVRRWSRLLMKQTPRKCKYERGGMVMIPGHCLGIAGEIGN